MATAKSAWNLAWKPYHLQNLWNLSFFYPKRKSYIDIIEQKPNCGHIIFLHKSYNDIVDKIVILAQKEGNNEILLFCEAVPHFFFR